MSRKLVIFIIIALALLAIGFIKPAFIKVDNGVNYQYEEAYIDEKNEGFDKNGNLKTHLPIIIIEADGKNIPGNLLDDNSVLSCNFKVIDNKDKLNISNAKDAQLFSADFSVKGSTSVQYPKKSYNLSIKAYDDKSDDKEFLGMPQSSNWILEAGYTDRSLFRNYMMYNICSEFMDYMPRSRLCEVLITDKNKEPQYMGVYTIREKVEVNPERMNLISGSSDSAKTSFLLCTDSHSKNLKINHLKSDDIPAYVLSLEYPDAKNLDKDTFNYIDARIGKMEKTLHDASHSGNWSEAEKEIDLNSFVDYFIVNEFFQNYEQGSKHFYIYKNIGEKFKIGPTDNFEEALNNSDGINYPHDRFKLKYSFYYMYLSKDKNFVRKTVYRYRQLRMSALSDENLLNQIDKCKKFLDGPAKRDAKIWHDSDIDEREKDIIQMKNFVKQRGEWMDKNFSEKILMAQ